MKYEIRRDRMTKENKYYYCTICGHVHLLNSEIGKLHIQNSFKIQKQKKEMELAEKGMGMVDYGLEKRMTEKRRKKIRQKILKNIDDKTAFRKIIYILCHLA